MITNKYHLEIKKEIEEINNNQFEIKTLRTALLIRKKVEYYYKEKKYLSYLDKTYLLKFLADTIYQKFSTLYPTINKSTLHSLLQVTKDTYNSNPIDLTIINNDIVLYHKEAYDNPYTKEVEVIASKKFQEVPKLHSLGDLISTYKAIYNKLEDKTFHDFYMFYQTYNEEYNKENPSLAQFFQYINDILYKYNNNKPVIEYTTKTFNIEYTGHTKLFINTTFKTISESILKQKDIEFSLITINDWNDIHYFKIKQKVNKDSSYTWNYEEVKPEIWNLETELTKQQNKPLTKKRAKNN